MSIENVRASEHWKIIRLRIDHISSSMETIQQEMTSCQDDGQKADLLNVLQRLEDLQEKFETILGQLAGFDDEGEIAIRLAKEDFRNIVRRYRIARREALGAQLH